MDELEKWIELLEAQLSATRKLREELEQERLLRQKNTLN
jgi:hypothetical protein